MRKLLGGVGAMLGSSAGWWAGARIGAMTGILVRVAEAAERLVE